MTDNIEELSKRFAEKNASLIRDLAEADYIRIKLLEVRQGKVIKCEIEQKNYKGG